MIKFKAKKRAGDETDPEGIRKDYARAATPAARALRTFADWRL